MRQVKFFDDEAIAFFQSAIPPCWEWRYDRTKMISSIVYERAGKQYWLSGKKFLLWFITGPHSPSVRAAHMVD